MSAGALRCWTRSEGRSAISEMSTNTHAKRTCRRRRSLRITTDGLENASREFSYDKVRRMIERQKERFHWEFMFLGANIDAVGEARRRGISETRAVRYEHDSEGTRLTVVVSDVIGRARRRTVG